MSEETKPNPGQEIQKQFAQVCTKIGELLYNIEELKKVQADLAEQFRKLKAAEALASEEKK